MRIDENEFFRTLTLKICGNLEIEEGLRACLEYLSQYMPADILIHLRSEFELGAMRILARASATECEKMDLLIPCPEPAMERMAQLIQDQRAGKLTRLLVTNKPEEDPLVHCVQGALGLPPHSAMHLFLHMTSRPRTGTLVLFAEGDDRFDEHHERLFAMLKEPFFVAMSNTLAHREVVSLRDRLADDNRYLRRELRRITGDEIIGFDFGLREVMAKVALVAPTESPVLLMGETGVGKDVIANAIHLGSARNDGPFIPVNCGAIPESLLDSELFGHEKGAFTGALSTKRGHFERADGGTILLDEIGEMPLEAQVRLLRVLQNHEIGRVGGARSIPLDIRIIVATNKDLEQDVKEGRFREDLWYRINVFPIVVPPLRERTEDIPALLQHFIERKARELKIADTPQLAEGAIDVLKAYDWPGNVREFENIVERAMILHRGEPLTFGELIASSSVQTTSVPATKPQSLELALHPTDAGSGASSIDPEPRKPGSGGGETLDAVIDDHIRRVLERTSGKINGQGGAAQILGMNPSTLRNRMKKLGIPFGRKK